MHPLKAARKARKMSLNALAIKIGLSSKNGRYQICKWESGVCVPKADRAEKLAHVLGLMSGEFVRHMCQDWKKWEMGNKERDDKHKASLLPLNHPQHKRTN